MQQPVSALAKERIVSSGGAGTPRNDSPLWVRSGRSGRYHANVRFHQKRPLTGYQATVRSRPKAATQFCVLVCAASSDDSSDSLSVRLSTSGENRALMNPIAPMGREIIRRAAYRPWPAKTTKTVRIVAANITMKNTVLKSQWTPICWPQRAHVTSDKISPVTEIESLEQFGHFLFNDMQPISQMTAMGH